MLLALVLSTTNGPSLANAAAVPTITKTYVVSTGTIANPERGFYRPKTNCDEQDFTAASLIRYRINEDVTLVQCVFYLTEFKNSSISQAQLDRFQRQANAVRDAGLKMILRFAYTESEAGDDAPLSRVQGHLNQLAPYLKANSDVIAVVQEGFIGAWGEGSYSQNFGNSPNFTDAQWLARKAVTTKLLSVLPATRMIQARTPDRKRHWYGTESVTAAAAYKGSAIARIGHHNDCFLASDSDMGTYLDRGTEFAYLHGDTTYVVMGGETCKMNSPRSDCPTAVPEMSDLHYSYLNRNYHDGVLASWGRPVDGIGPGVGDHQCWDEVNRRLGYRFSLTSVTMPRSAVRGTSIAYRFSVVNNGFATPFNQRPVTLVLRNTQTGELFQWNVVSDPRFWAPGSITTIGKSLTISTAMPTGDYTVLLRLQDPSPSLANLPAYAIQLANQGTWEVTTGLNNLGITIAVT